MATARRTRPLSFPFAVFSLCAALAMTVAGCTTDPHWEWQSFGGDLTNSQYAPLTQINTSNVHRLEQAWVYHTGDHKPPGGSQIQCNPIVVDGVLYGTSPGLKLFALDAATGEERWVFDPYAEGGAMTVFGVSRGVAYWSDGADRRILFTAGSSLYAIDATSGAPIPTFGQQGRVDLKEGLDRDMTGLFVSANTPGVVYRDLYILGGRVAEEHPAAPGHIRAFNVRSGAIEWIFHTIPHPGEYGYDTWPEDAWQSVGGANVWTGMSLDEERGLVFIPTGSASFDFWGGNREGANLFANTLLALDAATGQRRWHYQFVHHDLWDRDLPAAPNLLTIQHEGRPLDVVAQITKSGHVFVFERETGTPVFPIEEIAVPPSDLAGEATWPTQPLPVSPPPFARQRLTEADLHDLTPGSRALMSDSLRHLISLGQFAPPSLQGTIIFPGFDGGGEWGGAAHDPRSGILYVNSNEMPWVLQMVPLPDALSATFFSAGQQLYFYNCANCHGFGRQGAPGYPALDDVHMRLERAAVRQVIVNGGARMPGFPQLNAEERDALVGYLYQDPPKPISTRPDTSPFPYTHNGYHRFIDANGYPVVEPPWGTLNAIDLNRGEILWQVPLGTVPALEEQGLPPTGTENYGGPLVTAGGVLFIGASKDEHIRAYDLETGTERWKTRLPAGGYATPATYTAGGKQYVVIAAGGGKMGTRSGDAYVAFALPD